HAMKDWHKLKPELFKKQPYYLPGCDTYALRQRLGLSLDRRSPRHVLNFFRFVVVARQMVVEIYEGKERTLTFRKRVASRRPIGAMNLVGAITRCGTKVKAIMPL
ncbi:hypothetical protein Q4543_24625, partial [Salipiger sp. 1_MG-2023]|uniref:hypothetical protein n=1 Tax=Salipiger sp. 1_MG-2023 TaxID=3062665 RepID=UPI0026E3098F